MSNHPDILNLDTLMSRILLKFGPLINIIETKRSWKFQLEIPSGCHFRALLIFAKICPKNAPRHFENYIFAHISSSKHTLALKIGTDKVFDATNPKMKSELQKKWRLQWDFGQKWNFPGGPNEGPKSYVVHQVAPIFLLE